jgi:hypothetical protein
MTVLLWRSQIVFREIAEGVYEDEGDMMFRLDLDVYKDMGCPETITVTVVPGDTLNDGGGSGE